MISNKFLELFSEIEALELEVDADLKFGKDKSESSDYQTYLRSSKLKRIYDRFPNQIEQIVPANLVESIKTTTISLPARQVLEIATNMTDEFPGGEQTREIHLMTQWLLLAFDDRFQTKPLDEREFFESLTAEEQDQLNNEFPEDRRRKIREMRETKFGKNL